MLRIVPLSGCDPQQVETLLDDAFGKDRHGRTAYRLRLGMELVEHLSFGLLDHKSLVGSIQCWPVGLHNDQHETPLVLVGPVAVSPSRQNQGLGHLLMNEMLAHAKPSDPPMVMIGDPEYYERFGFYGRDTQHWELPGPWERHRLLMRNTLHAPLPETGELGPQKHMAR